MKSQAEFILERIEKAILELRTIALELDPIKEELLDPNQLGEKLGVPRATVLQWRRQGIIPAEIAIGKFMKFDYERVRKALRNYKDEW
jgi:hypothetical protein